MLVMHITVPFNCPSTTDANKTLSRFMFVLCVILNLTSALRVWKCSWKMSASSLKINKENAFELNFTDEVRPTVIQYNSPGT